MAESSSTPPFDHLAAVRAIGVDTTLRNDLSVRASKRSGAAKVAHFTLDLPEPDLSVEVLEMVLLMAANGQTEISTQAVTVEYLRDDQKLVIPAALGMQLAEAGTSDPWVPVVRVLRSRYRKLSQMTYLEIKTLVLSDPDMKVVRATLDAKDEPNVTARRTDWSTSHFYIVEDQRYDEDGPMIMALTSQILQFNCDVRDYGYLYDADATVSDGAWKDMKDVSTARLMSKLQPYTLYSIAALNYGAVHSCDVAAFVRAYGLSVGILPDRSSACQVEYRFTTLPADKQVMAKMKRWYENVPYNLYNVCLNLLAMFGLMHLNKDHTYRTGDAAMERIGTSYLNTFKVLIPADILQTWDGHKEALVRTAQHPFGLAQTYWLARALFMYDGLSAALKIRIGTAPPPVQRLMVARAGFLEWSSVPVGKYVQDIYVNEFRTIKDVAASVADSPPSYSDLHRLYDIPVKLVLSESVKAAVDALMPAVYGFALTVHVDEDNRREGMALALSLNNVARDQGAQAKLWQSAWQRYYQKIDKQGIEEFIISMANLKGGATE